MWIIPELDSLWQDAYRVYFPKVQLQIFENHGCYKGHIEKCVTNTVFKYHIVEFQAAKVSPMYLLPSLNFYAICFQSLSMQVVMLCTATYTCGNGAVLNFDIRQWIHARKDFAWKMCHFRICYGQVSNGGTEGPKHFFVGW